MSSNVLKRKYSWKSYLIKGASPNLYYRILKSQGGRCAICSKKPQKRGLTVDSNRTTGVIRGLLCFRCSICLGWLENILNISGKLDEIGGYLNNNWGSTDPQADKEVEQPYNGRPSIDARRAEVLDRLTNLVKDYPDHGLSGLIGTVAEEFGLSTRTVQRYIYDKNRKGV
jgi:Recombination endonuclease VII